MAEIQGWLGVPGITFRLIMGLMVCDASGSPPALWGVQIWEVFQNELGINLSRPFAKVGCWDVLIENILLWRPNILQGRMLAEESMGML